MKNASHCALCRGIHYREMAIGEGLVVCNNAGPEIPLRSQALRTLKAVFIKYIIG